MTTTPAPLPWHAATMTPNQYAEYQAQLVASIQSQATGVLHSIPQPPDQEPDIYTPQQIEKRLRKMEQYPDLPVDGAPVKRRFYQPKFKLAFDTLRDAHLRLLGTMIFVGRVPVIVSDIITMTAANDFLLLVQDFQGKTYKVRYNDPGVDLRSIEPRYVSYGATSGFLYREPRRQQKQGMHRENVKLKQIGGSETHSWDVANVMAAIVENDLLPWSSMYENLLVRAKAMPSLRLSNKLAVYFSHSEKGLAAEYNGRFLGNMKEDTILVSEDDYNRPWINTAVKQVNCQIRRVS